MSVSSLSSVSSPTVHRACVHVRDAGCVITLSSSSLIHTQHNDTNKSAVHQTIQLFAKEWARRELLWTDYCSDYRVLNEV